MFQIYPDYYHQLDSSSIDSKLRSHPMKALNGSKTMEVETFDIDNFLSTGSNDNPADIASPQRQNDFGYFNDVEDDFIVEVPMTSVSKKDSSFNNPSQKLIQPAQAEVYPHAKMQEGHGALNSLEIESDMDIVNHLSGNDDFFKQNQIYQPHNDVLHPVELSQYPSSIEMALVVPKMKSFRSSCYGNRTEEDGINIVNPQKDFFSADTKNSFYRPDYDDDHDDLGTSPKKKMCLAPREDQEHLSLERQTQATSQTSLQKSDNSTLPSTESLNSSCTVPNHTQDAVSSFMTEWFNNLNIIPLPTDKTLFIETNIPESPNKQPGNLFESAMNPVDMPSDNSISEPQSNSNLSGPSPLESVVPKKKRIGQHYLRDFVSGMLKMISSGKIGSFLGEWEYCGNVTKQAVISNLQKTKEATTKEERLKKAVRAQPQILKEATLMLVKEFIKKENYESWVNTEFKIFNFGCNTIPNKKDEMEKQQKREGYLNKRGKLCKKFLGCFLDE